MRALWLGLAAGLCLGAQIVAAQASGPWQIEESGTTASLRGIQAVSDRVAWASGSEGTVLRTLDGGAHWTQCAVPDGGKDGATLDFRGVQAWDGDTAIVMASGPGEKSRLYRTKNGCRSWKLILKNHRKDGFWDAIFRVGDKLWLLGDPVGDSFWLSRWDGIRWTRQINGGLKADRLKEGAFAASNSALLVLGGDYVFVASGGQSGAKVHRKTDRIICADDCSGVEVDMNLNGSRDPWEINELPLAGGSENSGAFAISGRANLRFLARPQFQFFLVAVGGDYTKPNECKGTAAWSADSGEHWTAAATPPHGYRSAVQWSDPLQLWITVGTNGSNISRDDGKTWQPLDNGNWNALSLPFVVGPGGRIARLNPAALPAVPASGTPAAKPGAAEPIK